ncbi:hypothetical protein AB1A63_15250, partial [Lactiplantibacillus paraplantarum]
HDAAIGLLSFTSCSSAFLNIFKIAILALVIIVLIYFIGDMRVVTEAGVLLFVGVSIALIPFLGWIGCILSIIGGSLYLAS